MIRTRLAPLAAVALLCAGAAARAQDGARVDVEAGKLSERVPQLARQAGISISVTSAELWRAQGKAVHGRMTAGQALAQLLAGTRGHAVQLSATSWRIEPVPAVEARVAATAGEAATSPPLPEAIIVTASKLDQSLANFAGTVHIIGGADINFGGERGTDSILSKLSSVSSTHLGSGRNKLFIRGLADSSFTGPTQSTVGQYLYDLRIAYNAPDPDLRLYDINRVEILEGSQGTLYGAGSLGGIIRIIPNEADPSAFTLDGVGGLSFVQHGQPGGDLAATINVPLGENGHALRVSAYGISEGGYIDNVRRHEDDINSMRIGGGRAGLKLDLGDGWVADVGGIYQATRIDDAQYADADEPPLTNSSAVVQASHADYGMASMVLRKRWGDILFQTSNAYVKHVLGERFDASPGSDQPEIFDQHNQTRMLVSETRLWRPVHDGLGWVIGISAIDNRTEQRRKFTQSLMRRPATGVSNQVTEITAYGKLSLEPAEGIALSAGGRLTNSHVGGAGEDVLPQFVLAGTEITANRDERQFLPSADALVHLSGALAVFARYEEGFRPGGLAIEGNFVRRYRNDHVSTWEMGARWGRPFEPVMASFSLSHVFWRDIQADFIDGNGLPSTANIGDGRITSVAGNVTFRPTPDLEIDLGAVYNHGRIIALTPEVAHFVTTGAVNLPQTSDRGGFFANGMLGLVAADGGFGKVPNVADFTAQARFDYQVPFGRNELHLGGWAKYIGPSRLGIGPVLGDEQGNYLDTGLALRIGNAQRGVTLTLSNLFDAKGNRFALGTPFDAAAGGFVTPQRPRTIRIGADWGL